MVQLFSYVMRYDTGFAPNPFWGYCTLATCKPEIRRSAKIGDWIVGTGSARLKRICGVGCFKLIYAMRVDKKLTFEQYSKDPQFKNKIPRFGIKEERGDNIYFVDENGRWYIRPSYHYEEPPEVWIGDLSGRYVLVSKHFFYFGRKAIELPKEFRIIAHAIDDEHGLPKHRSEKIPREVVEKFIKWLESEYEPGCIGEPCEFEQEKSKEFFENKPKLVPLQGERRGRSARGRCR